MTRRAAPDGPRRFELRVAGHLDERWSAWFAGATITPDPDGTTSLRGVVTDQAELHGLLTRVHDVGATLLSFTTDAAAAPGGHGHLVLPGRDDGARDDR